MCSLDWTSEFPHGTLISFQTETTETQTSVPMISIFVLVDIVS